MIFIPNEYAASAGRICEFILMMDPMMIPNELTRRICQKFIKRLHIKFFTKKFQSRREFQVN